MVLNVIRVGSHLSFCSSNNNTTAYNGRQDRKMSPLNFLWNYLCCIVNCDFPVWGNYTFWLMFVWPDSLTSFWLEPCSPLESPWTRTTVSPPPTLVQPPRKASSPREGVIGTESGVLFSFFVFFFFFCFVLFFYLFCRGGSWGRWRGNCRISAWKLLSPSLVQSGKQRGFKQCTVGGKILRWLYTIS